MCLRINKELHKGLVNYKPIKLTEDLTVYKLLLFKKDSDSNMMEDTLQTPYQHVKITFTDGKSVQPKIRRVNFRKYENEQNYTIVLTGDAVKNGDAYHSYVSRERAQFVLFLLKPRKITYSTGCEVVSRLGDGLYPALYKAVIPAGSYVYYGTENDIASNNLIILDEKINT